MGSQGASAARHRVVLNTALSCGGHSAVGLRVTSVQQSVTGVNLVLLRNTLTCASEPGCLNYHIWLQSPPRLYGIEFEKMGKLLVMVQVCCGGALRRTVRSASATRAWWLSIGSEPSCLAEISAECRCISFSQTSPKQSVLEGCWECHQQCMFRCDTLQLYVSWWQSQHVMCFGIHYIVGFVYCVKVWQEDCNF